MGVGAEAGDISWWSNNAQTAADRGCFFNDRYHFGDDGHFQNYQDSETWLEWWQYGGTQWSGECASPVAPHNGQEGAKWEYDSDNQTITLNGKGSYLGLPRPTNNGDLNRPEDAPESIVYNISELTETEMIIQIESGDDGWWQFKFTTLFGAASSTLGEAFGSEFDN